MSDAFRTMYTDEDVREIQFESRIPGWVRRNTILRCTVGSKVHGLNLQGTDDRDEMGILIEPPEMALGTGRFEQHVQRTQPEGSRSGHGDIDLVIYSLRKWVRLALGGNPTILLLLFVPETECSVFTPQAATLRGKSEFVLSKRAANAFLGYMRQQRLRLTGEAGQKDVKRPELVAEFGYDTKYAMHLLRLGFQGVELFETGRISLPMPEDQRSVVMNIREGRSSLDEVVRLSEALERSLMSALTTSRLRDTPDTEMVNRMVAQLHNWWWETGREWARMGPW